MRPLLPVLTALVLLLWPLATGRIVGFEDLISYYCWRYPLSQHQVFWTPYEFGGAPIWGDFQRAVLYPLSLPYYLMAPQPATSLSLAIHLTLAALGTWLLAGGLGLSPWARGLAALAFTLGFWPIFHLSIVPMISVLAWLPWLLWAARRWLDTGRPRWGVALGLCAALQWLAGHPQLVAYSYLAVLALAGLHWRQGWRRLAGVGLALGLGLALSGAQTVPCLHSASQGLRARGMSLEASSSYAVTPKMLWTTVSPYSQGLPVQGEPGWLWRLLGNPSAPYTGDWSLQEVALYPGLVVWLLVFLAPRRAWPWLAGAALSLWLSLGTAGGLYTVLYKLLPGGSILRTPSRISLLAALTLAVAAGIGLDQRPSRARLAGVTLALALLHLAAPAPLGWANHLPLASLLLAAAALAAGRRPLVVVALAADLLLTAQAFTGTVAAMQPPVPAATLQRLAREAGPSRVLLGAAGTPGSVVLWAPYPYYLRSLQGWSPMAPAAPVEMLYLNEAGHFPRSPAELDRLATGNYLFMLVNLPTPLTELLGARFVLAGGSRILEDPKALPRAWVPTALRVEGDAEKGLTTLQDPGAVLLADVPHPVASGRVLALDEGWDTVTAEVELSGPGSLATNLFYERGWQARVDGSPVVTWRAYYRLLGLDVPAGRHRVELRYRPPGLLLGSVLSLCGALALAAWGASGWRRVR